MPFGLWAHVCDCFPEPTPAVSVRHRSVLVPLSMQEPITRGSARAQPVTGPVKYTKPSNIASVRPAGGTVIPISFPTGVLNISPSNAPSTSYSAGTNTWTSYQTVAAGATSLSTVSFISGSMTGLPLNAQVSSCFSESSGQGLQ